MGIENFLPVQEEIRQWAHRRQKVTRVVIPMMIFVHATPQERAEVLTLSSVSRYMVLKGEHTPAVIPDLQMERFKFMLDYSEEAVEMCSTPLAPGEMVRVIKGPLAGNGRRAGERGRTQQGGSATGNAGICRSGYAGGVCGSSEIKKNLSEQ